MNAPALANAPFRHGSPAGRTALIAADPNTAVRIYRAAAEAEPADHEIRYWLSSALMAAGQADQARVMLDEARDLHATAVMRQVGVDLARLRSDPAYCADIGQKLYGAHLMGPASLALRCSLDVNNLNPQLLLGYGLALHHEGRTADAIDIFKAAANAFPDPGVHGFLIYALFHAPDRLKAVSDEARRCAALHAAPVTPVDPVFANPRTLERRLRVGYVGPSFTRNQLDRFLPPVLEAHDPEAVEVFLYCDTPDGEAELPGWLQLRAIGGVTHQAVAEMVRADGIDILIDVWGHVAGGRLPVFAYRPAPIQIAWLNFVQTTGLPCMDYILHADSMEYPGNEVFFSEEIWRIGPIVSPYRPVAERPVPVPTPALKNGYVTFGSFNNPAKLSDVTVAAWGRILAARPRDRLVLKYSYFVDPVLQRATQARFASYGAAPEQLEFRGHTTGPDYWREFGDIDLALDPNPCPGGTTSCDALASGVPVLTQWGDDFYARIGVPVVLPCGLPELIADGWDDYVNKALALTEDFAALDALRAKVRPGFDASPYRDEVGFTRRLEADFRKMFARWIEASA